jgi:hypothetical protein
MITKLWKENIDTNIGDSAWIKNPVLSNDIYHVIIIGLMSNGMVRGKILDGEMKDRLIEGFVVKEGY